MEDKELIQAVLMSNASICEELRAVREEIRRLRPPAGIRLVKRGISLMIWVFVVAFSLIAMSVFANFWRAREAHHGQVGRAGSVSAVSHRLPRRKTL